MAAAPASTLQSQPPRRAPAIQVIRNHRRYGRQDFEKFDQETARGGHVCVGSATIGKVDIDCKYHWRKAQWGVLGNEKRPAGIVYMDINFKQPHGYWLERARVCVTLSEDMSSYALHGPRRKTSGPLYREYAVQLDPQYFGPKILTGAKTVLNETKQNTFVPTLGAMGFEVGGIGTQYSASRDRVGRWVFRGTVCKPKNGYSLRTLEWELSENSLDPDQIHKQEYRTAFAFEHSKRPVFMRVEVEGKLRGRNHQMKHGLLKFSSTFGKKESSTLTKLDLGEHVEFKRSLDQIAEGLEKAMEMENCEAPPVEVPDPTPAQFAPAASMESHWQPGQTHQPPLRLHQGPEQRVEGGTTGREQEARRGPELQEQQRRYLHDYAADPVLKSLRQQLRDRGGSDTTVHAPAEEPRPSSDVVGAVDIMTSTVLKSELSSVKPSALPEAVDPAALEIAKIPALLMILKFIATILQRLSRPQQVVPNQTREDVSGSHTSGRKLLDSSTQSSETLAGSSITAHGNLNFEASDQAASRASVDMPRARSRGRGFAGTERASAFSQW